MGRRKIEITPITHERNRAVTFLKRKNGLFKKAYELGVLCSVDVAVIIFEERAGHHVKLHEYCSTDIDTMIQRHLHFDGERETKRPADFSKASGDADGHDDDDDDDGTGAGASSSVRPGASGLVARTSGSGGSHTGGGSLQRGSSGSGGGMQRSLMSGPRLGNLSGLDQLDYRPQLALPLSSSSHLYPLGSPSHPNHPPHPSLSNHLSHLPSSNNSLSTSYGGTGSSTSIPVSLERGSPLYHLSKRPRLDSTSSGSGQGPFPGGPSAYTIDDPSAHAAYMGHSSQTQSQTSSNPNLYNFTRPSSSSAQSRGGGLYGSSSGGGSSFASLLASGGGNSSPGSSASPQHTQHPEHGGQTFDLDWPVHNSNSATSNAQQAQSRISSGESGGGGGNSTGWLDFLSNAPASGTGVGATPVGAGAPSTPMAPDGGRTPTATGPMSLKRARSSSAGGTRVKEEDSDVSGRAGSVASVHSHSHSMGGNGIAKTASVINDLAEIFGTGINGGGAGKVSDIRTDMNWTSTRTAIDVGGWYP